MFGRRSRKHVEALEELREEFSAADRHARAVLTDAIAQIELRIAREREDREAARLSTETAIADARSLLSAQAKDVGLLLQQVADTCALVAERIEADRIERRAFVEAIGRLAQSPGALEPGEHPLGGTVFPDAAIVEDANPPEPPEPEEPPPDRTIDLRTDEGPQRKPRTLPRWATKRP